MPKSAKNQGFTLIETIIYIALFGIIMGGAVATTYQLMTGSDDIGYRTEIDQEASFLLAKIDWALTGAKAMGVSVNPTYDTLTTPSRGTFTFNTFDGNLELNTGAGPTALNSDGVKVSIADDGAGNALPVFERISTGGATPQTLIRTTFSLDGRQYSATKYLRY